MAKKDKDIHKRVIDQIKADDAKHAKEYPPTGKKPSVGKMAKHVVKKWAKDMNPIKETADSRRKLSKKIADKIEPTTGLRIGSPITKAQRDAASKRRIKRLRKKGNYGK
tara:strand:+ start:4529 stop:4855 length:327 start_codon:yes stop_codon:yes gene_type:complete